MTATVKKPKKTKPGPPLPADPLPELEAKRAALVERRKREDRSNWEQSAEWTRRELSLLQLRIDLATGARK